MKSSFDSRSYFRPKDILFLFKILCVVLQVGIFAVLWGSMQSIITVYAHTSFLLLLIYTIVLVYLHRTYSSLKVGRYKLLSLCTGHLLSLLLSNVLLFMLCTLSVRTPPSVPVFILVTVLQLGFSFLWCFLANRLYFRLTPRRKAAVIHNQESELHDMMDLFASPRYDIVQTIDLHTTSPEDILSQLEEMQIVFLGNVPASLQDRLISYCTDHSISLYIRPTYSNLLLSISSLKFMSHTPTLEVFLPEPSIFYRIFKRTVDIVVSGLLLLFTSPLLGFVAFMIRMDDGGPALFRQKRLTKDGRVFEIIKFRSMRMDAEKNGVARLATQNDDRITRIGKFIRATRLDELPQLWNILKGEMSLVGPRPERPEIAEQYSRQLPEFNTRLKVKAGLTGYAQIHGKYNSSPLEKLQMDLIYIAKCSVSMDIKLILQTIQIMLKKESTEGVTAGQTTALKNDQKPTDHFSA